jgi:hypothetical protein
VRFEAHDFGIIGLRFPVFLGACKRHRATIKDGGVWLPLNDLDEVFGSTDIVVYLNDPQGKFPCSVTPTNCNVTLPVSAPSFSRSNRYQEFALYAQDSWKVRPRSQ